MHKNPSISIIGPGSVGTALMNAALRKDIEVNECVSRRSIDSAGSVTLLDDLKRITGDILFITVTDDAIGQVSSKLAGQVVIESQIIVHCSGSLPASALNDLKKEGTGIASFHPIQSFAGNSQGNPFEGIFIDIQSEEDDYQILSDFAKTLGATAIKVNEEEKITLHIAASIASNFLGSLLDSAADAGALSGMDKSTVLKALIPLVQTTLNNINSKGIDAALTGAIVRGDAQTVEDHINKLKEHNSLSKLYKLLGERALQISKRSERIDKDQANQISEILNVIK